MSLKHVSPELVSIRSIISTINKEIINKLIPKDKVNAKHFTTVFSYDNVDFLFDYKLKSFYDENNKSIKICRARVTKDGDLVEQQYRLGITTNITNQSQVSVSWFASLCHSIDAQIVEKAVILSYKELNLFLITICDCFVIPFKDRLSIINILKRAYSTVFMNDNNITNKEWLEII